MKGKVVKKLSAIILGFCMAVTLLPGIPGKTVQAAQPYETENLVGDPSFEDDNNVTLKPEGIPYEPGVWYSYAGPEKVKEEAHTGNTSILIPRTDSAIEQDLDKDKLIQNEVYTAKVWAKNEDPSQSVYFGVKNFGGNEIKVKIDSTEYKEYMIPFTYTGDSNPRIYIWAEMLDGAKVYADDFSVVLSTDIENILFENGKITVQFADEYSGEISEALFSGTVTNSMNPDEVSEIALEKVSAEGKTLVLSYPEIAAAPVDQQITVSLKYKTSGRTYEGDFVIPANGEPVVQAKIVSLTAENGLITAALEADPTVTPKKDDFGVQYRIGDGEYTSLAVKDFSYDKTTATVTFTVQTLEVKPESQTVTIKVTCGGIDTETTYELVLEEGNYYYVDATEGSDENDGLTPETAWKSLDKVNQTTFAPGDHILFQCGETWTGELMPKGSGIKGNPIVISSYGEGDKPLFMPGEDRVLPYFNVANDVLRDKKINNGISFYNQEYWEIRNLELYDPDFDENRPTEGYGQKASDVYRRAINLIAEDAGDLYGFTIDNVTMHGFRGPNSNRGKSSGGVIVTILSDPDNEANRVPTAIHDITVTNCEMYDLGRSGFNFSSPWTTREDVEGDEWGLFGYAGYGAWKPCENIYIANNIIHDIDGDGILIDGCKDVLVEHNVVYRTARYAEMAVGMFNWNSDNTVFQFNEVYDTCPSDYEGETNDAQGIEIDALNRDTWVQYNYMHDNRGGVFMWCSTADLRGFRGIYRYNISQNDGNLHGVIDWRPNHVDSAVYNNTIYISGDDYVQFLNTNGGNVAQNPKIYNNIFYNTNENLSTYSFLEDQIDWKNNIFYNFDNIPSDDSNIEADPKLAAPGTGENGIDSVDGYKLLEDSPAIDAGIEIEDNGGRDYFGTALTDGQTDIGAAEYTVEKPISTAVLEYAIELAGGVNADGVIDTVKENFENALQNAQDILAKVQSGDASVTQNQVDNAWRNLIKAMQYMEFKEANKDDLEKVIALAEQMNGKLDKYLDEGKAAFTSALAEAKEVYENEIATQEEVTSAWQNLLDAMANMMLKPDKGLLEDLIAQAEGLNEADYEAQSFAVMRTALAAAKEVFDNVDADQEEIDASAAALKDAIAKLTLSAGTDQPGNNDQTENGGQSDNIGGSKTEGQTVASADKSNSTSTAGKASSAQNSGSAAKATKTGDEANVFPIAAAASVALLASAALVMLRIKKR